MRPGWVTVPVSGVSRPRRMSKRVVFPDPEGPVRAVSFPGVRWRLAPVRTGRSGV